MPLQWYSNETVWVPNPTFWNPPTALILAPGETATYAVRLLLCPSGPSSRSAVMAAANLAVVHAVPGYVIGTDMEDAALFIRPPVGLRIANVITTPAGVLNVSAAVAVPAGDGLIRLPVRGLQRGRVRVAVTYSDATVQAIHYYVIAPLQQHAARYGAFAADTAWLPADFPDPFARGASVMPWDREDKRHVLQDGRPFIVGLSDDAGGGANLGFASKAGLGTRYFTFCDRSFYASSFHSPVARPRE